MISVSQQSQGFILRAKLRDRQRTLMIHFPYRNHVHMFFLATSEGNE